MLAHHSDFERFSKNSSLTKNEIRSGDTPPPQIRRRSPSGHPRRDVTDRGFAAACVTPAPPALRFFRRPFDPLVSTAAVRDVGGRRARRSGFQIVIEFLR
jgi:hypothetical protein